MRTLLILVSAIAMSLPVAAQQRDKNQPNASEASGKTESVQQSVKDALLTAKVKAALARDIGVKTVSINVDSDGTMVTLKGTVDNEDAKRRAEEVTKKVEGVASVDNQLVVRERS